MRPLNTIGDNDVAREVAQSLGYSSAEEFKADYVDKKFVAKYDIKYYTDTKELVLMNRTTMEIEETGQYLKR